MPDYAARPSPIDSRDDRRFERLIEPLLGDAYALAQALAGDRSLAQDAVQSAALRAWQRMRQLRDDDRARPWLLAIVVNECRSAWRKRRVLPAEPDSRAEVIIWAPSVDQRLDVRSVMRRLKRDDRVILALRFLMDMSVDDCAAVLGISASAVKARTARAGTRFRELMARPEATE